MKLGHCRWRVRLCWSAGRQELFATFRCAWSVRGRRWPRDVTCSVGRCFQWSGVWRLTVLMKLVPGHGPTLVSCWCARGLHDATRVERSLFSQAGTSGTKSDMCGHGTSGGNDEDLERRQEHRVATRTRRGTGPLRTCCLGCCRGRSRRTASDQHCSCCQRGASAIDWPKGANVGKKLKSHGRLQFRTVSEEYVEHGPGCNVVGKDVLGSED